MPPKKKKATRVVAEPIEVIDDAPPSEHVVVQLQIPAAHIEMIIKGNNPVEADPEPYDPCNNFVSTNDQLEEAVGRGATSVACFWCCHALTSQRIGMPTLYSPYHGTFTVFGTFCSLECTAAYNFATNQGSDRVWEIHSWINLLARKMGMPTPVRPAPSRFLLKMFGGPMVIDDFRLAHKGMARTFVMNIPPLVALNPQVETINTSYIASPNIVDLDKVQDRMKISRQKSVVDFKKTLEGKMNLTYGDAQA